MLPPEIINRICDFSAVEDIRVLTKTSKTLGDAIHESTYHSAVLREHPEVDSFEKTWTSWEDLVVNIEFYSESWYPNEDRYDYLDIGSDNRYSDDCEDNTYHDYQNEIEYSDYGDDYGISP